MAIRALNIQQTQPGLGDDPRRRFTWAGLTQTTLDTGEPAHTGRQDAIVNATATGTFGAGGTVITEGSEDGLTWETLSTHTGTTPQAIGKWPRFIRPRVTAGDGTTNLAVTIVAYRPF